MKRHLAITLLALLAFVSTALSQQSAAKPPQDCRSFVQQFYEWYAPAAAHDRGRTWETAVKRKPAEFSPELAQAIERDSAAQAKTSDDIVGLDFDPFLSSQDPSGRFTLKQVKEQGNTCSATLVSGPANRKGEDVTAVLERVDGNWRFANFQYSNEQMDLMQLLKQMEADRKADGTQKK
ncbi:hypothetical protein Acid345_4556 [Candidatus Koribacter versatilis Ellin345]|uniref:Uncharacterized protein n=1 Tax=Koribacter versatilis (strain Ellin345) TaxID=204669 RepID=Q1IHU4_KORVE|nr:DUF3828 domain-containing protein [Candidatus Koribacter versatilis]ABF43556.1 hypothetical protein Acid345_4556 [Candidatus Koribacter versatilis Ellin345]